MNITKLDFYLAYKKVKADLFYSSFPVLNSLYDFEIKLESNIDHLFEEYENDKTFSFIEKYVSPDDWTIIPDKIKFKNNENLTIISNKNDLWKTKKNHIEKIELRKIGLLKIELHILSTLWIAKVGEKLDALLSDNCFGSRLKRNENHNKLSYNKYSFGTFKSYLYPFKKWKESALESMQKALDSNKNIVSITADFTSFFHNIDPSFLIDFNFPNYTFLTLEEKEFTNNLITALLKWSKLGLPVGLSASHVIANIALLKLDSLICETLHPIHYGRYVDDIIIVFENTNNFKTADDIWKYFFKITNEKLCYCKSHENDCENKKENDSFICYKDNDYIKNSILKFNFHKSKVFLLSGESGKHFIDVIKNKITESASEWRAFPILPDEQLIHSHILKATSKDGETCDNLRNTESITLKRSSFALKLRDIEAYNQALHPDEWKKQRHAFFDTVNNHILVLPEFFDYFRYVNRILKMAINCKDFEYVKKFVDAINIIVKEILSYKDAAEIVSIKGGEQTTLAIKKFEEFIELYIAECLVVSLPIQTSEAENTKLKDIFKFNDIEEIKSKRNNFYFHDLGYFPLRLTLFNKEITGHRKTPELSKKIKFVLSNNEYADSKILDSFKKLIEIDNKANKKMERILPYLFFSTRPLNLSEIYLLYGEDFFNKENFDNLSNIMLGLRGYTIDKNYLPSFSKNKEILKIPLNDPDDEKVKIGITSWYNSETDFRASISGIKNDSASKYRRLNKLLNTALRSAKKPDYVILPELAIPASWFPFISYKLTKRGISLISGVEYQHVKKGKVLNQVWASLCSDKAGFPLSVYYTQDKFKPAYEEERLLKEIANKSLRVSNSSYFPKIIDHGNFCFGMLICSELTNISRRNYFRGKIDGLFVLSWNKDIKTFSSIIEASAFDIHTFIIQCNNRSYGDSRIRGPYKEDWRRDVVRVKGGEEDFLVIGEIDVKELRVFQSQYSPSSDKYKPLPEGFQISHIRKVR